LLNHAELPVVIVTNQAGVARGIFPESFVAEAHAHLRDRLAAGGATLDGFYYCPHHPDGTVEPYRRSCDCRKPGDAMLRRAAAELDIDLARSTVVGDRWHDIEAGARVGARTVLVRTGYGRTEEQRPKQGVNADAMADNLIEAVSWILQEAR